MCKKLKFSSLYSRFFLIFLLIVTPLLLTQVFTYYASSQIVSEELSSVAASNAAYLKKHIEDTADDLYRQMYFLMNSDVIQHFAARAEFLAPYDYYAEIMEIQSMLGFVADGNSYIDAIRVYYPREGLRIVVETRDSKRVDWLTEEEIHQQISASQRHTRKIYKEDDKYLVALQNQLAAAAKSDKLPTLHMEILLDEETIRQTLSSYSAFSAQLALFVSHETDSMISGDSKSLLSFDPALVKPREQDAVYQLEMNIGGEDYWAVVCYSKALNASFVQLIPEAQLNRIPHAFRRFMIIFVAFAVAGVIFYAWQVRRLVEKSTRDLTAAFRRAGEGNFDVTLSPVYLDDFNQLVNGYNRMVSQIKNLIQVNYEHVIRLQRAEFKQLQSQINPHFLYNCFFMMRSMVQQDDADSAIELLTYLGNYFEYITRSGGDSVPLQVEYDHACNYLSIQQHRFDRALECTLEPVPEAEKDLSVPQLILQPILENAIKHCPPSFAKPLKIAVSFEITSRRLHIVIENSGALHSETLEKLNASLQDDVSPPAETTGLLNICKRIRFFSGNQGDLEVTRSPLGGLSVRLMLPLYPEKTHNGRGSDTPCKEY